MRTLALTILTMVIVLAAGDARAGPDSYCLQGRQWGYPGNCQFSSYAQCMATASGTDAYCGINPQTAFARQRRGVYRNYRSGRDLSARRRTLRSLTTVAVLEDHALRSHQAGVAEQHLPQRPVTALGRLPRDCDPSPSDHCTPTSQPGGRPAPDMRT